MKQPFLCSICVSLFFTAALHGQWVKTNGLSGGETGSFAMLGDTLLTATGGRLYYSTTDGQSWSAFPGPKRIYIAEVHTSESGILVWGTEGWNSLQLIARSDDFGQTWVDVSTPGNYFDLFLAGPWVYGSDNTGLYRTGDNGASWQLVRAGPISNVAYDGSRIAAANYGPVIASDDLGLTWDTLLSSPGYVGTIFLHGDSIFVFCGNWNTQYGLYVSTDGGLSWEYHLQSAAPAYRYAWHNGSIYGLRGQSLLKSSDFGQSWAAQTFELPYVPTEIVSVADSLLLGTLYHGVLRGSDVGTTWSQVNTGVSAAGETLVPTDAGLLAVGIDNAYHLQSDGLNWNNASWPIDLLPNYYGLQDLREVIQIGPNLVRYIRGRDRPEFSPNNGATWYACNIIDGFPDNYWHSMIVSGENLLVACGTSGVPLRYISKDYGMTFHYVESFNTQFNTQIKAVGATGTSLYALGLDKKFYRSDDGTDTWQLVSAAVPVDSLTDDWIGYGARIYIIGDLIYISRQHNGPVDKRTMLRSTDGGQTWVVTALPNPNAIYSAELISVLVTYGDYLLAGTADGVRVSDDGGANWLPWSEGLKTADRVLDLEEYDGQVWATVRGHGIWKRSLADLGLQAVSGRVFFDANGNAQPDAGEATLANVMVAATSANGYAKTNSQGDYTLLTADASLTLSAQPRKPYWTIVPPSQSTPVPASDIDFAVQWPTGQDLAVQLINTVPPRPGFSVSFVLVYRNELPETINDVILEFAFDVAQLVPGAIMPAPLTMLPGKLTWELGTLAPYAGGTVTIEATVPASVGLGDHLCVNARIDPVTGDFTPADNLRSGCFTVVGSYDPNDKQANPSAHVPPGEPVAYTVRFQNTGTYAATFVRIFDTIRPEFDLSTLQVLAASHPFTWMLRSPGVLEFFFENIQLPPASTDEAASHGFVHYSVKPRTTMPLGTPLRNTAHIFFDYNAPIVTNTTETTIASPSLVLTPAAAPLKIYPVPATMNVRVEVEGPPGRLSIYTTDGRLVCEANCAALDVDVRTWAPGAYRVVWQRGEQRREGTMVVKR